MEAEVTHKVLLVDDDPDNLTIVKRLLVKEGYQVQTVGFWRCLSQGSGFL